mgnify:CR=1 FL=1
MPVPKTAYNITSIIQMSDPKAKLIRIEPTDLTITLREIYHSLSDLCWINNLPNVSEMFKLSIRARAEKTIGELGSELKLNPDSSVSSSAGEYIVSELARSTVVNDFGYMDIPLAELIKQKVKGNPGFDFFAVNRDTVVMIFGEAKYDASSNAYNRALSQIERFVEEEGKDVLDMMDLEHLVPEKSKENMAGGKKGYIAAFSSTSIPDDKLKENIENNKHYQALLKYEEVTCVAVSI